MTGLDGWSSYIVLLVCTFVHVVTHIFMQRVTHVAIKADRAPECHLIQNGEASLQSKENIGNATEVSTDIINSSRTPKISDSTNVQQHEASFFHVNRIDSASTFSVLRETVVKFLSNMRSPTNFPLLVAVIFAVILLMQVGFPACNFYLKAEGSIFDYKTASYDINTEHSVGTVIYQYGSLFTLFASFVLLK